MNTRTLRFGGTRAHLLALATLAPVSYLHAANGTWNTNGPGNWSDTTKWTGGVVASGASSIADFSTVNITGDHVITIDQPFTIGTLKVGDLTTLSNSYTFAGTGPLTLDNGGSQPVLDIPNRTPTISAPLVGTNGLTKTGAGFVTLSGDNAGLSGVLEMPVPIAGSNGSGLAIQGTQALGGITTINVLGTATTGQALVLSGGITVPSGVTINLSSQGGTSGPDGAIRAEGGGTLTTTINGPININGPGVRIGTNQTAGTAAKQLVINGVITGGANGVTFRRAVNDGIHVTNTGNSWTGITTHSEGILWMDPGTLPAASPLIIAASSNGTVHTSGTFNRPLGVGAGEVRLGGAETSVNNRALGLTARDGDLAVNFGGAGAEVFFNDFTANTTGTPTTINTNVFNLNGAQGTHNLTLANPINLNGAARTLQINTNTVELSGGLRGGAFSYTKTGAGTLQIPGTSTWLGDLVIGSAADSVNAGIVRIGHAESLGAPETPKNINTMGLNRGTSILELSGGIAVDANKSIRLWGKNLAMNGNAGSGQNVSLRSASGNNVWNGNILIASSGGSYGVESLADTFTLGSSPATSSVLRNDVANSSRPMFFYGPGNFVVNTKIADNAAMNTGVNNSGVGTLAITRADNDFDLAPNLFAGTTEIVSLGLGGSPSSLGVATSINLGATLRYLGTGDTSDRSLSLMPTGATLDSSGTGALVLNSPTFTHHAGITTSVVAPFAAAATNLVINDAAGIAVGQSITGTNIPANTTITAVDVTTRTITISNPTSAASANGLTVTLGNVPNINRTLTLTGTNTGNNSLAAPLSNSTPGTLSVVKNGPGKWTLNGTSQTYTGTTTVNQGTLGFDGAFPANSALTVDPAATLELGNVALVVNPDTGRALDIDGALTLTGPVSITLPQAAPSGMQTILEYGSGSGVVNLTSNYRGTTFNMGATSATATTTPGSGLPIIWTGLVDGVWDTKLTGNWKNSGFQQTFFWGDPVRFDDTVSTTSFVSMVGELRPASVTIDADVDEYTLDGSLGGFLSGPFALTKAGTTTAFLGGANTFNGGVTINEGVLKPTTTQALGAPGNDVTVATGAQLDINGTMNANRDYDLTIAGTGVDGTGAVVNTGAGFTNGVGSLTLTGNATIGGSGRWDVRPTVPGAGTVDLAGFTLTKSGTNFMGLVDSLLTDGTINVSEGTLALTRLADSGVGAVNVSSGAALWFENYTANSFSRAVNLNDATLHFQSTANFSIASPVTISGTGTVQALEAARAYTILGDVGGSGSLVKAGDGNVILAGTNTWAGSTTISAGTLTIGNQNAISTLTNAPVTNNGTLGINRSDNAYVVGNAISGTGKLNIGQGGGGSFDSLVTLTGANSFAGDVTVQSGGLKIFNAGALGTGTKKVILTNGTNGRPQLYLDGSGGNITVPAEVSFETSSTNLTHPAIGNLAGDNAVQGGITLLSGGGNTAIAVTSGTLSLNGPIAAGVSNRRLVLGGTGGSGTINGTISNGTNPLGLDKMDSLTWTLTGPNSYTGTTVISAGTLLVNGNQGAASGAVSVASGATLGGTGTIGGNMVAAAGSTIAPGTSIGTLTTTAPVSIAGSLAIEVDDASSDRLTVGGSLDITGGTLDITTLAAPAQPAYVIASYGQLTGTFSSVTGVPAGYNLNYNYNGLNQIALVQGGDPYGAFEAANGIAGAGSNADSDNDGIQNGIEFVIGGDPSGPGSNSNSLLPVATLTATHLNFVFRRTDESAASNPFVEYGSLLTGWTTAQHNVNGVTITTENDGFGTGVDRVTVAIPRTLAVGTRLFARLRVNIP